CARRKYYGYEEGFDYW
nr:immunoglobulin heavy chain junction region [Mus musculus]